ncbi:MAG: hypothetical protein WC641_05095 [Patescibacteria group bacterium]
MSKRTLTFVLAFALVLGGAGCWKKTESAKTPGQPGAVKQEQQKPKPTDPKEAVLEAIANFRNVKYFKARYTIPLEQGSGVGELSFIKPDRLRVAMTAPGAASSEMVRVGNFYFIKVGNGAWQDISSTTAAKQSYESMSQALAQGDQLQNADGLKVTSTYFDKAKQCDLYTTEFKGQDQKSATVLICVGENRMPLYFDVPSASGKIHLEYYDIDKPFLIEKPL